MQLADYLRSLRCPAKHHLHAPAFSPRQRAAVLAVPERSVAVASLLVCDAGPVVAVYPACHRIDVEAVAELVGSPARIADQGEAARVFADCEYGIVSPFGHLYGAMVVLDAWFGDGECLTLQGATQVESVRMSAADVERETGAFRGRVSRPGGDKDGVVRFAPPAYDDE